MFFKRIKRRKKAIFLKLFMNLDLFQPVNFIIRFQLKLTGWKNKQKQKQAIVLQT